MQSRFNVIFHKYEDNFEGNLNYGSKEYKDYILYRTRTVLSLLETGRSFLLVDSDHIWLQASLMDWLKSEVDQDMIIENNGTPDKVNICAGMIFLNNTVNTLRVWRHVTDEYETARDDTSRLAETEQTILSRAVKKKKIFDNQINIAWKYFPLDHVFSGKWYKHPDIR